MQIEPDTKIVRTHFGSQTRLKAGKPREDAHVPLARSLSSKALARRSA
jgi:hypothetical protein